MQRVPNPIAPILLSTGAQIAYTVPAGTISQIANLSMTNTSASPVAVTLYNVPSGSSPSATNEFLPAFSLSAGQTYVPPQAIGLMLAPGSTLQALAATASVVNLMGGVFENSGS